MSRITDAINWMRPFHEAADGRTTEVIALAREALSDAPESVHGLVDDEGLRMLAHAFRRTAVIRTTAEADTLPLFVSTKDADGIVVHQPRWAVRVEQIDVHIGQWQKRRTEAAREVAWWLAQKVHATEANAAPSATLAEVWKSLGIEFEELDATGTDGA